MAKRKLKPANKLKKPKGRPRSNKKRKKKVIRRGPRLSSANTLRKLGMPVPEAVDLKAGSFKAQQKLWYGKLAAEGFDDIEFIDHNTGVGQGSRYIKRPDAARMKHSTPKSFEWYRLCAAYLQHNHYWARPADKLIWQMYTDGHTYREILKAVKAKTRRHRALFYVHSRIHSMRKLMMQWQTTASEGLLLDIDDSVVHDVMLNEPLPLDAD